MGSISFTALGGCQEVGRNAFLIESGGKKFLLDYGIDVQESALPLSVPKGVNGVFLSHAHIDHSGALPLLYKKGYDKKTFMTKPTAKLSEMLLKDSMKVQKLRGHSFFSSHDLRKMLDEISIVGYRKPINIDGAKIEFYDAGHIPGSASILLEVGGKRILYTGDINFEETELMQAADTRIRDVDIIISESTYSYKNHPKKHELADKLRELSQETYYNDGIMILPTFAVGRAQEILLILNKLTFPVFIDGMCIEATEKILQYPDSVRDSKELKRAFGRARKIKSPHERANVIKNPCIIVTTAGMLQGGPVDYYVKKLYDRQNCSIILTGYQVEGTPGSILMRTGKYITNEMEEKVKMDVKSMDFSAHCGKDGLINFYKKLNPKKIILVHGEHTKEFMQDLKKLGFDVVAPKNEEKVLL